MSFRPPVAVAAAVLTLSAAPAVRAQEAPPATPPAPKAAAPAPAAGNADPKVRKFIEEMVAAHKGLAAYSATIEASQKKGTDAVSVRSTFAYARPNKVRVATTDVRSGGVFTIISDGKDDWQTVSAAPKTYRKQGSLPGLDNVQRALRNSGGSAVPLIGMILADPDAKNKVLVSNARNVALKPDEKVDGVDVEVLTAEFPTPNGGRPLVATLYAGKKDHLLRRVTLLIPEGETATSELTEIYTNVKVNPELPQATFVFTPAPDQKPSPANP